MTDWATVASLATAAGTMVLAVATFSAVRSSTQSARIAERALLIRTRPLLMTSRLDDPPVKLRWMDEHWVKLEGSRAHAAVDNGVVYLALSVRNVASGVAVRGIRRPVVYHAAPLPNHGGLCVGDGELSVPKAARRDGERLLRRRLSAG